MVPPTSCVQMGVIGDLPVMNVIRKLKGSGGVYVARGGPLLCVCVHVCVCVRACVPVLFI